MRYKEPAIKGKERVLSFIEAVDEEEKRMLAMDAFHNSDSYKMNFMNRECEKGKEECLRHIVKRCYKNAMPLSDEYKNSICNDLDLDIDKHCPDGLMFYFKEGIRKGTCTERCKKMVETVCKEMEGDYMDRRLEPSKYNEEDLVFRMDPDLQQRMDLLAQDLELDDISDLINRSVKASAESEIRRAKEEKEKDRALEKELANDMNITSESAIERALELHQLRNPKVFQPTLFQGMMIAFAESVDENAIPSYTYHALESYGMEGEANNPMYQAFVESVREFTWDALENYMFKKKPRGHIETSRLANDYATGRKK